MGQLLAGDLSQGLLKESVVGVGKKKLDRGPRRLLFTMGMVEQNLVQLGEGSG